MAKKKTGGKKNTKKTGKAAGAARSAAKSGGTKSGGAGLAPKRISTGPGANPEQAGKRLVELFNAGKFEQVEKELWAPAIESIEGMGMAWSGLKAVKAKNQEWYAKNEIVGAAAEGPYVGATGFGVKFKMDVRERASGSRVVMEEIGVYTVKNGKIIREEFMYGPASPVAEGPKPA